MHNRTARDCLRPPDVCGCSDRLLATITDNTQCTYVYCTSMIRTFKNIYSNRLPPFHSELRQQCKNIVRPFLLLVESPYASPFDSSRVEQKYSILA